MNYKLISIICVLSLLIAPAAGNTPPWGQVTPIEPTYNINIWGPDEAAKGSWITIEGRMTDSDGNHRTKHHTKIVFVDVFIDSGDGYKQTDGHMFPNGQYYMYGKYKITTNQRTSIYACYTDPTSHITYTSNVHVVNSPKEVETASPLSKYIGYAKGFFALVWFGSLFVAIGMGSLAAQCHDPEKKQKYTSALFDLIKILFTVTIFYMATLFLMSS